MTMGIVDTMMVGRQPNSAVAIGAVSGKHPLLRGGDIRSGVDAGSGYARVPCVRSGRPRGRASVPCQWHLSESRDSTVLMGSSGMGPILRAMNIPQSVLKQAIPYLRAINWSTFPLLLYFVFRRYLQGIDLAKPVMFSWSPRISSTWPAIGHWSTAIWDFTQWERWDRAGRLARPNLHGGHFNGLLRLLRSAIQNGFARCVASGRISPAYGNWSVSDFRQRCKWGLEVGVFAVATAMIGRWARSRWRAIRSH